MITISQFIGGLYLTVYAAMRGGGSVAKYNPRFLLLPHFSATNPPDPASAFYGMCFRGAQWGLGSRRYCHVCRIRYGNLYCPSSRDTHHNRHADLLAFLVVVYLAVRSNANKVPISRLFKTIVRDATYYFLVIFTSHLTFMMFLLFAKVRRSP